MQLRDDEHKYQKFQKQRYAEWMNDIDTEEEGEFQNNDTSRRNLNDNSDALEENIDDSKDMLMVDNHDDEWKYEESESELNGIKEYNYVEYPPLERKVEKKDATHTDDAERRKESKEVDGTEIEINADLFNDSCDFDSADDLPSQDPFLTPINASNTEPITSTQGKDKDDSNPVEAYTSMSTAHIKPGKPLQQKTLHHFVSVPNKRDTPDETSPEPQNNKHQRIEDDEAVT